MVRDYVLGDLVSIDGIGFVIEGVFNENCFIVSNSSEVMYALKSEFDVNEEDEFEEITISYVLDTWGSVEDLRKRHDLERMLGIFLKRWDLGYCDGGDIGSGSMTTWIYVHDTKSAWEKVREMLKSLGFLTGATVNSAKYGQLT